MVGSVTAVGIITPGQSKVRLQAPPDLVSAENHRSDGEVLEQDL
jgi:hypothetical protein